jgi:hypothetical protein
MGATPRWVSGESLVSQPIGGVEAGMADIAVA